MNKLMMLRQSKQVSQSIVAKAVGITPSYYGMLELGVRTPSLTTACSLASYFEKSIEEIFLSSQTTLSCLNVD